MTEIEFEHKILGYKEKSKPIEFNDKLIRLGEYLEDIFSKDITLNCNIEYDGNLKKDAKIFFKNKLINLHDILLEKKEETKKVLEDFNNKEINTYKEMLIRIFDASKLTSPYNIPIKYIEDEDYMYGILYWRLYSLNNNDFLKRIQPIFNRVELSNSKTKLSYLAYIHELIHSQVDSVKYNIENYYYAEVASIFFERVAALDYNDSLLELCTLERYQSLYGSMCSLLESNDINNKLTSSTYIVSTIIAEKIFDIYIEGNPNVKKSIMNMMQKLFDGKITLESILKELDITIEKSSDIILLKKHL